MDLDESIRLPRLRQRRDVNILNTVEEELDKDAHIIADSTGMPMWSVFLLFALVASGLGTDADRGAGRRSRSRSPPGAPARPLRSTARFCCVHYCD